MRRHKQPARENHERWLVSYADFITLLFAFFVVMFASTQSDKGKAKEVSESVRDALTHSQISAVLSLALGRGKHENSKPPVNPEPAKISENLPPPPVQPERHAADLSQSLDRLKTGLDTELKKGKVQVKLESRGLIISLREATFFRSGDSAIDPTSVDILTKIAKVIQDLPNPVRLEGHTDAVPIHTSRFRNNWDLSVARAIAMLELFETRFDIPLGRMSVGGYAENAPTDTNETVEGRSHNRRVDVVVLSAEGVKSEPQVAPENAAKAPAVPEHE
jgi:chemotaxis protein MotB